ncbi:MULTISPECIES: SDR family NAD(P)-dependent oxidoreductase [unclassified Corynebacterium]|uniref:SDR family NAD(P)-dependent oxidoreductase n=1 Tax=unclassified Corynebacterium TaxID=2624378 RepID=UPI00265351E5|nr:SDR family NAD(P)-dependent oxidoreductase [Corynebacterium sp.]MDN6509228.1 SDR family NAD(P)-dependent oxidoreductase [Corynebacterium sp.]
MNDSRTIVITGASDGIGAAAARHLAASGHRVVLVGRSPEKTRALADELDAPYHLADFQHLDQVRDLASDLLDAYPRIDVLANNAGGIFSQDTTQDGYDKTFQVNHLAPFLLTNLLLERLRESHATVIQTASIAARLFGDLDLSDLDNSGKWSANKAYGDAKLENILFTGELDRRFGDEVNAVAFHPGVVSTSFASDTSSLMKIVYHLPVVSKLLMTSPEDSARLLVDLALGEPGTDFTPGGYHERGKLATKVNPQVHDAALAEGLWERSAELTGVGRP